MFHYLIRQFVHLITNLSELLEITYRFLFRWQPEPGAPRSLLRTLLTLPLRIFGGLIAFGGWLVMFPFHALTTFKDERRRDFMYGLPAGCMALFALMVPVFNFFRHDEVNDLYRGQALSAIRGKDFEEAKVYLGRIVNREDTATAADRFHWALVLANTGQVGRAAQIIDDLAPDNSAGFADAHRYKALNFAINAQRSRDPEFLKKLRFHLDNAGESTSPEINQAWALYLVAVGQHEDAIKHLQVAAKNEPKYHISIADIHRAGGNENGRQRSLRKAEVVFREKLSLDPLDQDSRILLANTLSQQEQYDEAESVLMTGIKLQPNAIIKRAGADFFVMRHDLAAKANESFSVRMNFLRDAIALEDTYLPIYNRLMHQYEASGTKKQADEIKDLVQKSIASGKATAFSHFVLGNILWMEGNKETAAWHIEQAYLSDKKLITVANNLAWVLAHQKEPDLERAHQLILDVIQQAPDDPRFLDTYGTILLFKKQYQECISPLERALARVNNKLPIHQKLEQVYQQLGNEEIARLHRVQIKKLMEQSE